MHKKLAYYYMRISSLVCQSIMEKIMCSPKLSHISMFHNVVEDSDELTDEYCCHSCDLINYIEECQSLGIEFISLDELLALPPHDALENKAVITFDDGFESTYTIAAPILTSRKIPFVIYVTTSFLGNTGYLTPTQVKSLALNPLCTIGMHAHNHVMFRDKLPAALQKDFQKCKRLLQDITSCVPIHYAFPYGSPLACSRSNIVCIKRLGVKSIALTTSLKLTHQMLKAPYHLPRLNIPGYYIGYIKQPYRGLPIGGTND